MSRKGENIYRRKDGRWEGRCIVGRKENGRYRYSYVYARTYREAKEKLSVQRMAATHVSENTGGDASGSASVSAVSDTGGADRHDRFRPYAEAWLEYTRSQVRESTYIKYRNLLNFYLLPSFGDTEWNALDRKAVETFCRQMLLAGGRRQQGLSPKTVSDIMSVLRGIFRYASNHGIILSWDISSVVVRRERRQTRVFSRREEELLCRYLRRELNGRNLGILICLFAGLRLGEICALQWEDISFSEQTIHVHKTMQRLQTEGCADKKTKIIVTAPKSRDSIRTIPIPAELIELLKTCRKNRNGYVLTGRADAYVEPRTMERHFARVLRSVGMEHVNFHVLRHTFATRCVEADFDAKSLSEILGHASVNITLSRYVHPSMELKRAGIQRLAFLLAVS